MSFTLFVTSFHPSPPLQDHPDHKPVENLYKRHHTKSKAEAEQTPHVGKEINVCHFLRLLIF